MIELNRVKVFISPGTPLEKQILNGIDLKIKEGEFVTVIGTNGAGKSTFLNIIAGEVLATEGTILIDNKDTTQIPSHERAQWVARVFQDPLLGSCGDLTIAENMALAALRGSKRGLKPAITHTLRSQCQEVLSRLQLGLENRLDTPMNQLSDGQRQAVSLAMSALSPMKILLLDEHTSALDPKTAEQVMNTTSQIVEEYKLTVLMVTHNLTQALQYGTRTLLIHQGKVAQDLRGADRASLNANSLFRLYGDSGLG